MRPLSQQEIDAMKLVVRALETTTAHIWHLTEVPDGTGGTTVTYVDQGAVQCYFYHRGGTNPEQMTTNEMLTTSEPWVFIIPVETAISHKDQIRIGSRTFEVSDISGPSTIDLLLQVGAKEVF